MYFIRARCKELCKEKGAHLIPERLQHGFQIAEEDILKNNNILIALGGTVKNLQGGQEKPKA